MRKLKLMFVMAFMFLALSSFTVMIPCSCGSPASGSQVLYSTAGESCCEEPGESEASEIFYRATPVKGVYEIIAVVKISNSEGIAACCPPDA